MANLAVAKASIQSAEAAVRDAELNLEFTKVVSPIDGRVSRAADHRGEPGPAGHRTTSTVLTTVVTTDPIYVYFNIDEPALLKYQELRAGRPDRQVAPAAGSRS